MYVLFNQFNLLKTAENYISLPKCGIDDMSPTCCGYLKTRHRPTYHTDYGATTSDNVDTPLHLHSKNIRYKIHQNPSIWSIVFVNCLAYLLVNPLLVKFFHHDQSTYPWYNSILRKISLGWFPGTLRNENLIGMISYPWHNSNLKMMVSNRNLRNSRHLMLSLHV